MPPEPDEPDLLQNLAPPAPTPAPAPPLPTPHGPCVPLKVYEEALAEIDALKKELRSIRTQEYRQKKKAEYYQIMAKKGKSGQVLSKKAKKEITKECLSEKYSEGVVNRIVDNKKKSHKYSNKGLHMSP